ncbi:MAG: heavy metal translocating P-type ATPase [Candidatus Thorarchaeota archaeon]
MSKNTLALKIEGIDCSGCARNFERILLKENGILDARINIVYKKIYIDFDPIKISKEKIITIISQSGYSVEDTFNLSDESKSKTETRKHSPLKSFFKKKEIYTTILSGIFLLIGVLLEIIFQFQLAARIILIFATIIGGIFIFRKAFFSIKKLNLDINVLMTVAAIAALIINESSEAASIVFLFSIAELAETFSVERAKGSIENLINYAPTEARVLLETKEIIMPAEEVEVNSIILVKPGERIPLDGKVFSGESFVNQAPITGESQPVYRTSGEDIYAGSLNEDGILKIQVTKPYEEIFLKKIINLVESSDQRAPIERYVDTFAKYYTPIMFLIASLTLLIPPLITGDPFIEWVYVSLIILVISCPCAVVLSTPITIVAALNRAAKNGVLIKGGSYIESLSKTEVFVFDKTGTLTIGHPKVVDIITSPDISREQLIAISGSLESNSTHPIAKAIKEKMIEEKQLHLDVQNFKSIVGKGIQGKIEEINWQIGNPRLIIEDGLQISDELASNISILQAEGKTVIIVIREKIVVGLISVSDPVKPHAKGMVCELRSLKAKKIMMLSGDNSKTAAQVASQLGIDEFKAELLPDQKLAIIKELNEQYGHVAMIGDGINDAPSLASANVGIAMGVTGSDIALEAADVALMTDRLDSLHYLVSISKK